MSTAPRVKAGGSLWRSPALLLLMVLLLLVLRLLKAEQTAARRAHGAAALNSSTSGCCMHSVGRARSACGFQQLLIKEFTMCFQVPTCVLHWRCSKFCVIPDRATKPASSYISLCCNESCLETNELSWKGFIASTSNEPWLKPRPQPQLGHLPAAT